MNLEMIILPGIYSIVQVTDINNLKINETKGEFLNISITEDEISLVINELYENKLENVIKKESGYSCLKIEGVLDFSEIGILAKISTVLAENKISIFAVSTYNTDYILVKKESINKAVEVLKQTKGINIKKFYEYDIV